MEDHIQAELYDKAFDAFTAENYDEFTAYLKEGLAPSYSNNIFMQLAFIRDDAKLISILYEYGMKHPSLPEIDAVFHKDSINVLKELIFNNYPIHDYHIKAVNLHNASRCKALINKMLEYKDDLNQEDLIALIKDNFI